MRTLLTAALLATAAYAGPPMICHEVQIGNEKSLPWGVSNHWDNKLPSYDRSRLIDDTLALLNSNTQVLVRMETLRRASIYAAGATPLAAQLADALVTRAKEANADPLAAFDAGYFIEAVHQLRPINKSDPLAGIDGYSLAKKSLTSAAETAAIEYGLSLMQAHHNWPNEHFRKAKAGAKDGSLLAANLKQFENR